MNELLQILGLQGKSRPEEEALAGYHQEILGGGAAGYEILGAAIAQALHSIKTSQPFNAQLAAQVARRTPVLAEVQPTKKRRWPVGFGPTPIPPLSTVTISSKPQVWMRAEKIVDTSPNGSAGLYVQGLFVGNKPQMTTFSSAIAMSSFAGTVLDNELMLDTCDPALDITWQIQNTTSATITWSATMFGHAVQ